MARGLGDRLRAGEAGQCVLEAVWDGQEAPSCLGLKHVWAPVGHSGCPGQASVVGRGTQEVGAWGMLWSPGRSGCGASDTPGAPSVPPTLDLCPWCPRWAQALLQSGQCVWLVRLTFCGSHLGLGLLAQSRPHAPTPTGPGWVDRVGPGPTHSMVSYPGSPAFRVT